MSLYHKILQNPQNPNRLLLTNIGVAVAIIVIAFFCYAKILLVCTIPTFIVSGATLLYLILMRWQLVIPSQGSGNTKMKYPLSTRATIKLSLLTIIFWAIFPSLSIAAVNQIEMIDYIDEMGMLYHQIFGFLTIALIVLTLIVLMFIRIAVIIIKQGGSKEWWRLFYECLDVICTIVIYFVVYVIGFSTTYDWW